MVDLPDTLDELAEMLEDNRLSVMQALQARDIAKDLFEYEFDFWVNVDGSGQVDRMAFVLRPKGKIRTLAYTTRWKWMPDKNPDDPEEHLREKSYIPDSEAVP